MIPVDGLEIRRSTCQISESWFKKMVDILHINRLSRISETSKVSTGYRFAKNFSNNRMFKRFTSRNVSLFLDFCGSKKSKKTFGRS